MKFTANTNDLIAAIASIRPALKAVPAIPVMGNILLRAANSSLKLTASNPDQRISVSIACVVSEPGESTVAPSWLGKILDVYEHAETEFEVDDKSTLILRNGTAQHKIYGLPSDDYPITAEAESKASINIGSDELRRILKTCKAHAKVDPVDTLMSVTIRDRDGMLSFEATDRTRCCVITTQIPVVLPCIYVIPIEAVPILLAMDGEVLISFGENSIKATDGRVGFETRCFERHPMDFMVPIRGAGGPLMPSFDRKQMIGAVKRAQVLTDDKTAGIKLVCTHSKLTVSGSGQNSGDGSDIVPLQAKCEDFQIGVYPSNLLSILENFTGEYATLSIRDHKTPFTASENNTQIAVSPILVK